MDLPFKELTFVNSLLNDGLRCLSDASGCACKQTFEQIKSMIVRQTKTQHRICCAGLFLAASSVEAPPARHLFVCHCTYCHVIQLKRHIYTLTRTLVHHLIKMVSLIDPGCQQFKNSKRVVKSELWAVLTAFHLQHLSPHGSFSP